MEHQWHFPAGLVILSVVMFMWNSNKDRRVRE
jgi:hypothetical protein